MKCIPSIIFFALAVLLGLAQTAAADPYALDRYIVVLEDNVESPGAAAKEIAQFVGGQVGFVYEHALKGFSIKLPPQAVGMLRMNPRVKYAADDVRYAFAQVCSTGIQRIFTDKNPNLKIDGRDDYRVDVDVVEAVFRSHLPAKTLPMEVNVRAALQQCARECFEEAAKVCEDGVRDGPLSPAERYRSGFIRDAIRSLAEEVGK